jgi:chromosome segregation ATPase
MLNSAKIWSAVGVVLLLCLFLTDSSAQTRKRTRRTSRPVVTNPPITPADGDQTGEAKVVSTADETTADTEQQPQDTQTSETKKATSTKKTSPNGDEQMQRTINSLSNQVERLTEKLSEMQDDDKQLLDMERLTRAEQRAENLRAQLIDAESKLADLQSKLEQIDYSLKPENIDRATATYGSTRPEEIRDTRRRQLENEKSRVEAQIRILETSKARLESSLVLADNEVDRLRRKMEMRDQQDANASSSDTESKTTSRKRPE